MKAKRIVLTGGPGTGKTTIINSLKEKGTSCFNEISREVIRAFQTKGIENPFKSHQKEFSELLFKGRIEQFTTFGNRTNNAFYDRGIHDVLAYMEYANEIVPQKFKETAKNLNYDTVFIFPPWEKIYNTDSERFESFEQACKIHEALLKTYSEYNYQPIEVPTGTVGSRLNFITNILQCP